MNIQIIQPASNELFDALEYYENEQAGLGRRFWHEVDEHLKWIKANPSVPRFRSGLYRRVNLRVFPYTSLIPSEGRKSLSGLLLIATSSLNIGRQELKRGLISVD